MSKTLRTLRTLRTLLGLIVLPVTMLWNRINAELGGPTTTELLERIEGDTTARGRARLYLDGLR